MNETEGTCKHAKQKRKSSRAINDSNMTTKMEAKISGLVERLGLFDKLWWNYGS